MDELKNTGNAGSILNVDVLPSSPFDYLTGTVFRLPNGQLWRVSGKQFIRMTKVAGGLKAGEARWLPDCLCGNPLDPQRINRCNICGGVVVR